MVTCGDVTDQRCERMCNQTKIRGSLDTELIRCRPTNLPSESILSWQFSTANSFSKLNLLCPTHIRWQNNFVYSGLLIHFIRSKDNGNGICFHYFISSVFLQRISLLQGRAVLLDDVLQRLPYYSSSGLYITYAGRYVVGLESHSVADSRFCGGGGGGGHKLTIFNKQNVLMFPFRGDFFD